MGDVGHRRDIDHFQCRVGRAFQEQGRRVRLHRRLPLVQIGTVDEGRFDPVTRQKRFDDITAGAEQGLGRDHMIAGPDRGHDRQIDRSHAAGGPPCSFGSFQSLDPVLEHGCGRIGITRIDEPRILTVKPGFRRLGVRIDEALRQKKRFGRLAVL